jgi:hypothetical protein
MIDNSVTVRREGTGAVFGHVGDVLPCSTAWKILRWPKSMGDLPCPGGDRRLAVFLGTAV